MRHFILSVSVLFVAASVAFSQTSPRVLSYQGMLRSNGISNAGNHSLEITIYGDASGTIKLWQSAINTTVDSTGVFNCELGTPDNPLPSSTIMDQPLWIGVAIDSGMELRPLAQVTASAYALNVADSAISTSKLVDQSVTTSKIADSSITSSKLGTDYISSISVNGEKVTGNGTALNIAGGAGINVLFDQLTNSLYLSSSSSNSKNGGNLLSTAYLGARWNTTTLQAEEIPTAPTNQVLHGDGGVSPTWGPVNLLTDVSGILHNANGGTGGTPAWSTAVAAGGNTATDYSSTVSGGAAGIAENFAATVSGGYYNAAYGDDGVVAGGEGNTVGVDSADPVSYHSVISGGANNTVLGANSTIAGGTSLMLGAFSFGFNGDNDTGGAIVRGDPIPRCAAITNLSDTLGGPNMTQIAYFGNVNMMIGNVDGTSRQIQFYSPQTNYKYSGAKYTSFQAGSQSSNINYTLPTSLPIAGQFLQAYTVSGTNVELSWDTVTGSGGGGGGGTPAWYLSGNTGTAPPLNYLGTQDSNGFEIHLFDTAAATGTNKRVMGYYLGTTSPNIVGGSSGNSIGTGLSAAAILSGGSLAAPNSVTDNFSVVAGGQGNIIQGPFCTITGGEGNVIFNAGADHNTISGGDSNVEENPSFGTISGGAHNLLDTGAWSGAIGGGYYNTVRSPLCFIGAGENNTINTPGWGFNAVLVGGSGNWMDYSVGGFLGGGYNNELYGGYTVLAGGFADSVNGQYDVLVGGNNNHAQSNYSMLGGGQGNIISSSSDYSVLAGGDSNQVYGEKIFQGGGCFNTITSKWGIIVGGCGNTVTDTFGAIGGGQHDSVNAIFGTIAGGQLNVVDNELGSVGGGQQNIVDGDAGTIGGGFDNTMTLLAGDSTNSKFGTIAGGTQNFIGALSPIHFASYPPNYGLPWSATIGGGFLNSANGHLSVVSGGASNFALGAWSCIPGGVGLIAMDFQTVVGQYNDTSVNALNNTESFLGSGTGLGEYATGHSATFPTSVDYPIFIVGNGYPGGTRTNGFTVSIAGNSTVYRTLGPVPAGVLPPNSPFYPSLGSTYTENTIVAEADVNEEPPSSTLPIRPYMGIGVDSVSHDSGTGVYVVFIHVKDPVTDSSITLHHAIINVTVEDTTALASESAGICGYATCSRIGNPVPNAFVVRTYAGGTFGCVAKDFGFYFHLTGKEQ